MQEAPTHTPQEAPAIAAAVVLSDDLPTSHVLLAQQAAAIAELQDSRLKLMQKLEEQKLLIAKLLLRLAGHQRERVVCDPNQLPLDFGDDPTAQDALADAAAEAQKIIQEYTVRREINKQKKPPRTEKFPEHLERYEVVVEPPAAEQTCDTHGPKSMIGYDTTETLEFERPKLKVRVTKYPKYVCATGTCGVTQAERPTGLVEGNRFDTSIAAEIITAKYGYHLPFYRQQDYFAGCDDTRVTLILPPAIPEVDPKDPRSLRVHEVFQEAFEAGRTSINGRMWAYRPFELPLNVFDFTVSRHRDGPDEFLENFQGTMLADCYSGFQKIGVRTDERIVHAACWAHARRKILEGRSSHPASAAVLLAWGQQLYDLEDRAKVLSGDDRLALRLREADPIFDRIEAYVDEQTPGVLPKSVFAEALGYLRNHRAALRVYLSDGRIPIDNNDVEQLMKQVAVGRKNWLFLGSLDAGRRAATLLTLISSALRNDLDVWAYLKDVLDRLLAGSTNYESLRPDIWKKSHPAAVRTYRVDERRAAADLRRQRRARRRQLDHARGKTP